MKQSLEKTFPLRQFLKGNAPDVIDCLEIFLALCHQIRHVHAKQMVHNDIHLDSCRIDVENRSAEIAASAHATRIDGKSRLHAPHNNPNIDGQIAYMAPERTGRTAHPVDFRSDYYSLGVVLYRLLTGVLPFDYQQPLEMIHAHIALPAVPVDQVNPNIPLVVSQITSKLLAKFPGDRYQSATGLIFDIKKCLGQLKNSGKIEVFALATRDVSLLFNVPTKLYGRYRELQLICDAYKGLGPAKAGALFFNGPPGIGKSFLVQNTQHFLLENNGHFISGKFDQYEEAIPYSAVAQAFSELTLRFLTLRPNALEAKRTAILNAIGQNGQVVIDIIPELELIIGKQPVPEKLSSLEARNRLNYLFPKFVRSIATEADPIILFLDDMQWADRASLDLMEAVLGDSELGHLLFIGTYRNIEARKNQFLGALLETLGRCNIPSQIVRLEAVDNDYIEMLLEDMLAVDLDNTSDFIQLIARKTNCNPFFIKEFLISLYEEGLIRFIYSEQGTAADGWRIDLQGVLKARLPETIIDLLTRRIGKLSQETQDLLKIAACIGIEFSTDLLAAVAPQSARLIRIHLKEARDQGMLVPIENGFKFIHDRVRETVYQLNDTEKRTRIHHAVGRALISKKTEESTRDIFLMASQLNSARPLLSADETVRLIQLSLEAGKKAKHMAAFATARDYLLRGIELLGPRGWDTRYALTLTLHTEAAETAYMCADFDQAENLVGRVLQNARTYLDQVDAYEIRISCLASRNRFAEMLHEGADILKCLGCRLPKNPGKIRLLWEMVALKRAFSCKTLPELKALKSSQDPRLLARSRIISTLIMAAYRIKPYLFRFMVLNSLRISLKRGSVPDTALYFSFYGLLLSRMGKMGKGYEFGKLALEMIQRLPVKPISKANVLLGFNGSLRLWKNSFHDTLDPLLETYRFCMESGNPTTASSVLPIYFNNLAACGTPMGAMLAKIEYYYEIMRQYRQKTALEYLIVLRHQLISNFTGSFYSPQEQLKSDLDVEAMMASYATSDDKLPLGYIYFSDLVGHYYQGHYSEAVKYSNLASKSLRDIPPSVITLRLRWYDSLARLALIRINSAANRTGKKSFWRSLRCFCFQRYYLARIAANQKALKIWSRHSPKNLLNKWTLVEAERANVGGKTKRAEDDYHRAIELSRKYGFLHEEALANELLALFYLRNTQKKSAQKHFEAAIDLYQKWGAEIQRNKFIRIYQQELHSEGGQQKDNDEEKYDASGPPAPTALSRSEMDLLFFTDSLDAILKKSSLKHCLVALSDQMMHYTGAQRILILINRERLFIGVDHRIGKKARTLQPVKSDMVFPDTLVQYISRTREAVLIDDAAKADKFANDAYIRKHHVRSAVGMPLLYQTKLVAILYLENNLSSGVFTSIHLNMLKRLGGQIALLLENELLKESQSVDGDGTVPAERLITLLQERFGLTPREATIASHFKQGLTRKQICDTLAISSATLKKHLQTIYDKTVNLEENSPGQGRVDKLSRLILFLFKQSEYKS